MSKIATINGLPVYNAVIADGSCGMYTISLVEDPAVMVGFQHFDAQKVRQMYAVADDEKRLVRGCVMRCDFPIYRSDPDLGEYYVIYSAEQIRKMAEKYLKEGWPNSVNLEHNGADYVSEVNMVQYFIKGDGVSVEGFDDCPDGSLFAEFHVNNAEVWDAIKAGTYKGFSLEGYFALEPNTDTEDMDALAKDLEGKFNQIFSNDMTKTQRMLAALAKMLVKCGNVTTDKGVLAWDGDEDLKAGDGVYVEDQEGNRSAAADGDYVTEDGKTIVVVDGKVAEIIDPEAEVDGEDEKPAEGEEKPAEGETEAKKQCNEGEDEEAPAEGEGDKEAIAKLREEVDELYKLVDGLLEVAGKSRDEIAEMKASLQKPKAKSAHEEFNETHKDSPTGVKGIDKLSRILNAK